VVQGKDGVYSACVRPLRVAEGLGGETRRLRNRRFHEAQHSLLQL